MIVIIIIIGLKECSITKVYQVITRECWGRLGRNRGAQLSLTTFRTAKDG